MLVQLYFTPMLNDGREQQTPLQRSTKNDTVSVGLVWRKLNIGNRKRSYFNDNKGNIVQNTEVRVGNERKNIHEQNDVYFSLFTLVITSHEGLNRALVKRPL